MTKRRYGASSPHFASVIGRLELADVAGLAVTRKGIELGQFSRGPPPFLSA